MSEVWRQFYMSEQTSSTQVVLSPINGLVTHGDPDLQQVTLVVGNLHTAPCSTFTNVASCGRYEVLVRRVG